jgi:hypothetical protein
LPVWKKWLSKGYIDKEKMKLVIEDTPKSSYREYLEKVLREKR